MWKLIDDNYQLIEDIPSVIYGSCIDGESAVTRCGKILMISSKRLIEIEDKIIIQHIREGDQFLDLTEDGYLYHLYEGESRLLRAQILAMINPGNNSQCQGKVGLLTAEGKWICLFYELGNYHYVDILNGISGEFTNRDRIVTSDGSISWLTIVNLPVESLDFLSISMEPRWGIAKIAADLTRYYTINSQWNYLAIINQDGQLYLVANQYFVYHFETESSWSDLIMMDDRCYAVNEHDQIYYISEYKSLHLLEIPPQVINGSDRFNKTKNSRSKI